MDGDGYKELFTAIYRIAIVLACIGGLAVAGWIAFLIYWLMK